MHRWFLFPSMALLKWANVKWRSNFVFHLPIWNFYPIGIGLRAVFTLIATHKCTFLCKYKRDTPQPSSIVHRNGDLLKCLCNVIDKNMFIQSSTGDCHFSVFFFKLIDAERFVFRLCTFHHYRPLAFTRFFHSLTTWFDWRREHETGECTVENLSFRH